MGEVPEKAVICIEQDIEEQKQDIDKETADKIFFLFLSVSKTSKHLSPD